MTVYSLLEQTLHVPWVIQAALLAAALLLGAGVVVRRQLATAGGGVLPDEGVTTRNVFEVIIHGLGNLARDTIGEDWRRYFAELASGGRPPRLGPSFRPSSLFDPNGAVRPRTDSDPLEAARFQHSVDQLIRNWRVRGHMTAQLDPLERPRPCPEELDPARYGLTDGDLDRLVSTTTVGARPNDSRSTAATCWADSTLG